MLENYFKFQENGTTIKTEIIGGITTFFAMAYILGINPILLSKTGMPTTGVLFATAISSGIACIIMGLLSRYPVGLAPGMGVNALFTYTIVLGMNYSWQAALAAVFLSNIILLIVSVSKIREIIINVIPLDLKLGIGAGIGFYDNTNDDTNLFNFFRYCMGFITYSIGTIATGKFKEIKPEIYILAIVFGIYIFFGL